MKSNSSCWVVHSAEIVQSRLIDRSSISTRFSIRAVTWCEVEYCKANRRLPDCDHGNLWPDQGFQLAAISQIEAVIDRLWWLISSFLPANWTNTADALRTANDNGTVIGSAVLSIAQSLSAMTLADNHYFSTRASKKTQKEPTRRKTELEKTVAIFAYLLALPAHPLISLNWIQLLMISEFIIITSITSILDFNSTVMLFSVGFVDWTFY